MAMRCWSGLSTVGLAAVLILGCSDGEPADPDGDASDALAPCEPLASHEQPITLGEILAIGQADDGTLYVVDHGVNEEDRIFVSNGNGLVRARVRGSGGGTSADGQFYSYVFDTSQGDTWTLAIDVSDSATRMALMQDNSERDFEAVLAGGEKLTVVDESAIEGVEVHNLPGDIEIEYFARAEDGAYLVVTRPTDDWTYEDFRLFYGDDSTLSERRVVDVTRYKDGGTTYITFKLDGSDAKAFFPSALSDSDETASLTTGGKSVGLTKLESEDKLGDFGFECLK